MWVPRGLNVSASAISATAGRDITTSVTVSNVLVDGTARTFKYNVTSFDPARTGPDTVFTSVNGPSAASVGAATPYKFTAIPHATGYRWEADYVVPLSLLDTAAGGPGNVTVTPASVSVTTSSPLGDGAPCYQLTNDPPAAITLNQVIIPTATSTLQFSDLMGYATQTELGEIQISTDQGLTWNTLYSRPGTGGAPEAAFTPESVSLSPYAGLECIIRFVYSATGTYRAFSAGTGWFVENISVNNAWQVQGTAKHGTLPAAASSLAFTAPQAGTYALRVVPVFYGSYPDVYLTGPVLLVGTDPSQ